MVFSLNRLLLETKYRRLPVVDEIGNVFSVRKLGDRIGLLFEGLFV